jgi:glutamate synthase domain-containing protein 3
MNSGLVVINGSAGDVLGYGMRGGRVYVRGDVGYRVGIHMKSFGENLPTIVVGGHARDFLGEYMAGGEIFVLGFHNPEEPIVGSYVGTGMHAGVMYVRGEVQAHQLGKEVHVATPSEQDSTRIREVVEDYARVVNLDAEEILSQPFVRIFPYSSRPYGRLYVY